MLHPRNDTKRPKIDEWTHSRCVKKQGCKNPTSLSTISVLFLTICKSNNYFLLKKKKSHSVLEHWQGVKRRISFYDPVFFLIMGKYKSSVLLWCAKCWIWNKKMFKRVCADIWCQEGQLMMSLMTPPFPSKTSALLISSLWYFKAQYRCIYSHNG